MRHVLDRLAAATVLGGAPLVAHPALTPEVWPASTLDVLYAVSAVSAGSGLLTGVGSDARAWFGLMAHAAGSVMLVVAVTVGLAAVFGEDVLATGTQLLALGVTAVGGFVMLAWLVRSGSRPRPDPDRDARREAIRENVRREIAEIERAARETGR